jgi:excisionase family DNA binding protein
MARSAYGLGTDRDVDWRQHAACGPDAGHGLPQNAWFPEGWPDGLNRAAARVYNRCPVRSSCLAEYEAAAPRYRIGLIAGGKWWDTKGRGHALPKPPKMQAVGGDPGVLLLLRPRDAAVKAGCAVRQIYRAIDAGKLPAKVVPGEGWRIDPDDLDAWQKGADSG